MRHLTANRGRESRGKESLRYGIVSFSILMFSTQQAPPALTLPSNNGCSHRRCTKQPIGFYDELSGSSDLLQINTRSSIVPSGSHSKAAADLYARPVRLEFPRQAAASMNQSKLAAVISQSNAAEFSSS